ncbi:MAG: Xaa-Pro peptidase family protein [Candidatus Omnitrophota bacterium]
MEKSVKTRSLIKKAGLDALLVTGESNILYLTDFPGKDVFLLLTTRGDRFFFTDERALDAAKACVEGYEFERARKIDPAVVSEILKEGKVSKLGFESKHLSYDEHEKLKGALRKIRLVPTKRIIETARAVKCKEEILKIKRAARITKKIFPAIRRFIKPGVREKAIANEIDMMMRMAGATNSFETIVASGHRSAWPHAIASQRRIKKDDIVLLDFGARFESYCSDFTRVVFTGGMKGKIKRIYGIVKDAQRLALRLIKPGVSISRVVRKVNLFIEEAGFGKFILHGLGHGLGLEVHEAPNLSVHSKLTFKKGMVFTVEPGLYIPRLGGIRIEDLVYLTDNGPEVLTR